MGGEAPAGAPWSQEAEISVLGAMLIDDEARAEALERLTAEDFYREGNARVFRGFRRLQRRGLPGDVVTLADELDAAGDLDAAGGMAGLAELTDAVPTAANLPAHADRLRELRALRQVRELADDLRLDSTETAPGEAASVLEDYGERIRGLRDLAAPPSAGALRTAAAILADPDARTRPATVADRLAWAELTTLLAAREKSGKSTLLRWAAARVSAGLRVWEDAPTPEGPHDVLWAGQEREADVAADLDRLGADAERIWVRDLRLLAGNRLAALRRDAEAVEPALLVVDTLSTLVELMDLDPGASTDWDPVMARLGALAVETGAAVVVSHHARKSDGEYRDSTAIGAGVDAILEMRGAPGEGPRVRRVSARARSAVPARDFRYALEGTGAEPRLRLLDGSLSLEERVQRFVAEHRDCSQREVREAVRGRESEVVGALRRLSEDDGPLVCDDSSTPYRYRTRDNPRGTAPEPLRNRPGTAGGDSGGRSGSGRPLSPRRGEGAGTAGRVTGDGSKADGGGGAEPPAPGLFDGAGSESDEGSDPAPAEPAMEEVAERSDRSDDDADCDDPGCDDDVVEVEL